MKVKKWLLAIATFAVMAVVCAVAAGAENTHTAYIKYADNDWEPSIMDYSGRNELGTTWKSTTCDVSDDGTYTVSISNIKNTYVDEETGDERTEAIGGEGAVVYALRSKISVTILIWVVSVMAMMSLRLKKNAWILQSRKALT